MVNRDNTALIKKTEISIKSVSITYVNDNYNAVPTVMHFDNLTNGAYTVNLFATFSNSLYETCQVNKTMQMAKVGNILNNLKLTYKGIIYATTHIKSSTSQ